MSSVIGMHFVCKDELNVLDHGDGTFDTGFWKVALTHCASVEYVALHQSRDRPSYRQGEVSRGGRPPTTARLGSSSRCA